ncbi:MAG TPA: S8 family serine peptidase [Candidatus Binatia bacterium]|nr:S8 family serine peptidase [Candidatus Binatia bacterium]
MARFARPSRLTLSLRTLAFAAVAALLSHAEAGAHVASDPPVLVPPTSIAPAPAVAADPGDPGAALDQLGYAPGRVIVKMKRTVGACLDCLYARGLAIGAAIGAPGLDDVGRRFGLRGVRPLRASDAALGTIAARRRAERDRRARRTGAARSAGRAVAPTPDMTSIYVLELSPWLDMDEAARELASDAAVEWAEPNRKATVQLVPNDPYVSSSGSWGQPFADMWGLERIHAREAWDVGRGAGAVVAVIDTGVDAAHPDIAGNMWANPGEIPGNGIDDDANGYVDDVAGWDFTVDDADPFDDHGHGTHVAGTIAATADNAIGVAGIAFEAKIMAVKGLNAYGSGYFESLALAIVYAAENGADVINASWGGFGTSHLIDDAIDTANGLGTVFVAAAGNSNLDVEESRLGPFTPAAHRHAITVAAFDHLDQKAYFSNFGAKIDVAAPGGGDDGGGFEPFRSILSLRSSGAGTDMTGNGRLVVGTRYVRQAGTSMASPHVAGVAALVRGLHPEYSPAQVRQAIRTGADDVGSAGVDVESGYGRVNAAGAVALAALDVEIDSPAPRTLVTGTSLAIDGSASGAGFVSYTVEYGAAPTPATWTVLAGPISTPVSGATLATWDLASVPDGDYVIRVRATNADGDEFQDRTRVVLDHVVITDPAPNTILRPTGSLAIRGTAAGGSFQRFRVEWRQATPDFALGPWRADGIALAGSGNAPVTDGLLATLDTSLFPANTHLDFRIVVTQAGLDAVDDRRNVVLDATLREGWPQRIPGLPQFDSALRLLNHVTIADLDDDGTKEILAAYGDMVWVFRHDGSLMPGWPRTLDQEPTTVLMRRSPAAADLDGDGRLEVVAADSVPAVGYSASSYPNTDIYVWHDDGTPMAGWPKPFRRAYSLDPNDPVFVGGGPRGDFVLSDVDGDGHRDIVAVIGPAVFVIDAQGNVLPGWPQTWPSPWPCLSSQECSESLVAVGDVDGDGRKEIAVVVLGTKNDTDNEAASMLLYASDGSMMPGFPKKVSSLHYGPSNSYPSYTNAPIMADLDGDGRLEIVAMTNSTKLAAFRYTGQPASIRPRKAVGTDNTRCGGFGGGTLKIPPMLEPPTAGDLDGDGAAELLVATHSKSWMWKRSGRGISTTICLAQAPGPDYINAVRGGARPALPGWPVVIPFTGGDHSYGPGPTAIGDIDGDLLPEVVSGSGICGRWDPPQRLEDHVCFPVSAHDRFGHLLPGFPKSVPLPGPTNGVTPAIGDLDGDGLKEIVWVDFAGDVLVWNVPGTPAPEAMQWPMFRHDPGHTGALVANP